MGRDRSTALRASLASLIPALLGLAVSAYLTVEHFSASATLACPETGAIDCVKVTTSRWSQIAGVPVAVLGLGYFIVMTALVLPTAWRTPRLDAARVAGAAAGVVTALYLLWAELFRVDAICLWCTVVHLCAILLLAVVIWYTSMLRTGAYGHSLRDRPNAAGF